MSIYKHNHLEKQPLSSRHLPATSGVYEIVCIPTGQRYIGGTSNLNTRVRHHRYRGRTKTHTPLFNEAWAKWGEAAFTMRVLEEVPPEKVGERERWHIRMARESGEVLLNPPNSYGGEGLWCNTKPPKLPKDWSHIIDIYTSTEPPKVLQERWNVSHACVSLIRSGKRGQKVLRMAGLIE